MQNDSCRILPNSGLIGRNAKWFPARRWLGSVADYLLSCAVLFFPLHRTPRDEAEKATKREDLRGVSPAPEKKSEEHGKEAPASTRLEAILREDRYTLVGHCVFRLQPSPPLFMSLLRSFPLFRGFLAFFSTHTFSGGHVGVGVCVCLISRSVRRAARIL